MLPTCVSINPGGRFAAVAGKDTKASEATMTNRRIDFKLGGREEEVSRIGATWLHLVAAEHRDLKHPRNQVQPTPGAIIEP